MILISRPLHSKQRCANCGFSDYCLAAEVISWHFCIATENVCIDRLCKDSIRSWSIGRVPRQRFGCMCVSGGMAPPDKQKTETGKKQPAEEKKKKKQEKKKTVAWRKNGRKRGEKLLVQRCRRASEPDFPFSGDWFKIWNTATITLYGELLSEYNTCGTITLKESENGKSGSLVHHGS